MIIFQSELLQDRKVYLMKRISPLLSIVAIFVLLGLPASAYHWVLVGQGNYVDADSIRSTTQSNYYTGEGEGSVYTLWTKYIADEQPIERMFSMDIWSSRAKVAIDCENKTATRLSYYAYDAEGFAVAEYPKVNERLLDITDDMDNPAAEIYKFVCNGGYKTHVQHRHHTWRYGD